MNSRIAIVLSILLVVLGCVTNCCETFISPSSSVIQKYGSNNGSRRGMSETTKWIIRSTKSETELETAFVSYYGAVTEFIPLRRSCNFSVNYSPQISSTDTSFVCKVLEIANKSNVPVRLDINAILDSDPNQSTLTLANLRFLDEDAPTGHLGSAKQYRSYYYLLVGRIRDVLVKPSACYISVETGFNNVEYNAAFHRAFQKSDCLFGVNAFISESTVVMVAKLDTEPTFANDVESISSLHV